jgi:hypothetical protein
MADIVNGTIYASPFWTHVLSLSDVVVFIRAIVHLFWFTFFDSGAGIYNYSGAPDLTLGF